MNHTATVELVRQLACQCFAELGADTALVCETILVLEGCYVGRRFRCGGFETRWLINDDRLETYSRDGTLQKTSPVNAKLIGSAEAA